MPNIKKMYSKILNHFTYLDDLMSSRSSLKRGVVESKSNPFQSAWFSTSSVNLGPLDLMGTQGS